MLFSPEDLKAIGPPGLVALGEDRVLDCVDKWRQTVIRLSSCQQSSRTDSRLLGQARRLTK